MSQASVPSRGKSDRWINPKGIFRLAFLTFALSLLGLLGDRYWLLDLFNHFQAQYFAALLLASITLAAMRSPRLTACSLLFLTYPASRLAPLYLPRETANSAQQLRVGTFNVHTANSRYGDTIEWIQQEQADLLYLPECDLKWGSELSPLNAIYPHRIDCFIPGNFGFAFVSKYPIVSQQESRLGRLEIPLLEAVIATPHGEVTVFGAHPVPPVTRFWAEERDSYLATLAAKISRTPGRVVLIGDLNATRWSTALAPIHATGIEDSALGHGFSATWMRSNPAITIPIDHIFFKGFTGIIDRSTGPGLGSDHRPVSATLAW